MNWEYFTESEILNPYFDDCPHNEWNELPLGVQANLQYVMKLLENIREHMNKPIRITSTYRPNHEGKSAHKYGKAIDFQYFDGEDEDYLKTMDYLIDDCPLTSFRAILEWKGKGHWIHIDRNYRNIGGKVFMIGFPKGNIDGEIVYRFYDGKVPREIARLA